MNAKVLYVHPANEFNVHFPFSRGDLNVHGGVGGSLSAVLADIETIWGHCIENLLEIPKSDLKVRTAIRSTWSSEKKNSSRGFRRYLPTNRTALDVLSFIGE